MTKRVRHIIYSFLLLLIGAFAVEECLPFFEKNEQKEELAEEERVEQRKEHEKNSLLVLEDLDGSGDLPFVSVLCGGSLSSTHSFEEVEHNGFAKQSIAYYLLFCCLKLEIS